MAQTAPSGTMLPPVGATVPTSNTALHARPQTVFPSSHVPLPELQQQTADYTTMPAGWSHIDSAPHPPADPSDLVVGNPQGPRGVYEGIPDSVEIKGPAGSVVPQIPRTWVYAEGFTPTLPDEDEWWRNFGDPALDSLIAMGQRTNYDVAMALRRINLSRYDLQMARSAYYPQLSLGAGWNASRSSGVTGRAPMDASTASYFDLGLQMSWEIDVFGKITRKVKEQKALVDVSRAEYAGVQVSVAAQLATAYITLRTYQSQLAVAYSHISSQEKILKITQARHEAGLASMLDVTQAKVVLYSTKASIPGLEAAIRSSVNSILVLVGSFPGGNDGVEALLQPAPMPTVDHIIYAGVPADLLRRRPDLLQAEARLAADAAALGVAKSEFLPTLTIDGSIGTAARRLDDLFTDRSFTYSVSPRLSWTVFSGLSRRAAVQSAREQAQIDLDSYNFTLQTAVQEAENAIISYTGTLENINLLQQTVDEASKSLELAVDLYRNSLSPFTNVIDSQMNLLSYQNSLVSARGSALKALVSLYKALGGGWKTND